MSVTRPDVNEQRRSTGHGAHVFRGPMNGPNGQKRIARTPQMSLCSDADSTSASKHEELVRGDAPESTAVAGGSRNPVLIRLSACMFWHRFTKTTAGVSRYLPPGHSECGFPASVSLCRPKGPANLVGMLNMSHSTRRYHGPPRRTGQCSQWSVVHVCLRKRACSISQALSCRRVHGVHKCVLANGNATFQSLPNHSPIASTSLDGIGVTG